MADHSEEAFLINQAQLVLAEKRTSLATLRTGIAVMALPMAVLSFLIAVSRYYEEGQVLHWLVPLLLLCALLLALGGMLTLRALRRLHHQEILLRDLKRKGGLMAELINE